MRQVPHYAIIGNGRMAKHLCHYFGLLGIEYQQWDRAKPPQQLEKMIPTATHVVVLIPDADVDTFIAQHIPIGEKLLLHFSGALQSQYAYTTHPLQTFSQHLYSLENYQRIPFMIESAGPGFNELLPGLTNPHFKIEKNRKAYYHSLCVMANNFTTLLWQKFFTEMKEQFEVLPKTLMPYLEQTMTNLKTDYKNALTGPIARKDKETLIHNLHALEKDSHFTIFEAFVKTYALKEDSSNEHS